MALISVNDVSLSFGGPPLLDRVNLQIDRGERVCLVGRNGAGKSTLMKLIAGELNPDSGLVMRQPAAVIARLQQEVPAGLAGTVRRVVEGEGGAFEQHNDWERHDRVERLLRDMGLPAEADFAALSAGQKRRVLLARGLVADPQLLLLDEPTNHLDLESIEWLEEFLLGWGGALVFVTHDRAFVRRLATRIIEIDRGRLIGWACDYDTFLVRKQAVLEAEEVERAQFDKKLAQEEAWIRQGVRAQRSRAQNRIHALQQMRAERAARRERTGTAKLTAQEADRSGFKVVEGVDAGFRYDDHRWVIRDLSVRIERGDKIGIVGPNGAGKTTLLRLLLGQLAPTTGTVEQGTRLEVVYYDQLRAQLKEDQRVQDAVADGNATVTINGRTRHVISYLEDFLFEPARARTPIRALSGGERNRLLLARLFTKPCNVLVLDEPTNDLDAETLELLEDLLVEFGGTVLLVSHDRAFLNEVCTSLLVFEGDGHFAEYLGGYDDWQRERRARTAQQAAAARREPANTSPAASPSAAEPAPVARRTKKLSNKERAELAALPQRIEALEAEQGELVARLADPEFLKKAGPEVGGATARLAGIEVEITAAYARWEELEAAAKL